jgi:phage terminase large subunit-like protein
MSELESKMKLLKLLRLQDGLPHLYAHPLYEWQLAFIEAIYRMIFITAANQAGKSSGMIIKLIRWATEPELWEKLWRRKPIQIWYFYPTREVADKEFRTKWVPLYLPRNEYKQSLQYGWEEFEEDGKIAGIQFKNGLIVYFMTYEQKPKNLQASTLDAVFFDEEPPEAHFNEMVPRTSTNGYLVSAFTATLGQEYLRLTMEEKGPEEKFPNAWKRQISLWDCLVYADGSPSRVWTIEKIEAETKNYTSEAEIQRRIHGKFVKSESVMFQTFSRNLNVIRPTTLGPEFLYWAGVDAGSGGALNHPAAIVIVAVHKSFLYGHVVKCWRGDGIVTTSQDIIKRYVEMAADLPIIQCSYDYAGSGADVGITGGRLGLPFVKAIKDRASGISTLNTLFKSRMLTIFYDEKNDPDAADKAKLISELASVTVDVKKTKAKDDLTDALRYCVGEIPWHFRLNELQAPIGPAEEITEVLDDSERRRRSYRMPEYSDLELELMEAAELYEGWGGTGDVEW